MAEELDFSGALDRVLQQQATGAPTVSPATPATPLAPTTNLLTGAAPTPSPFAAALDRVLRGDTVPPPAATAPAMTEATPAPALPPSNDAQVVQEAASGVAAANGLLAEGVRPEVVAEIRRISRDQGIPLPLAAQTYIERAQAAPGDRYRRLLQQNPGLRRIATQGAAYADFMPDADGLATTEQAFTEAKKEWSVGAVVGSVQQLETILDDTLAGRAITRSTLQTMAGVPALGASLELGIALDIGATEDMIIARIAAPYGGWAAMENYPASMRMSVLAAARQQYNLVQGLTEEDRIAALQRAGEYYFSAHQLVAQAEGLVRNPGSQSFITNTLSQAPNTVAGTLEAFASDPVNGGLFLAETIIESAPQIVAMVIVSRVTGSLSLGSAVAATTGGSREYVLSTTQFLAERGYTINSVEDAIAILQNPKLMQEAADFGFARAIPIAILDGLAGVASGVRLGSTALGDVAAQTAVQTASGVTGEALAQLGSEGKITSPRDITIEALAELPTALIEVPLAAGRSFGSERLPPELNQLLAPGALQSAADQAAAAQQALETARAAIEETATFARDPEAVRELLVAAGDQEVSIPVQEIERLYQEGALTDDDIAYLNVEDELTQQGELSGDVVTTASRVLTLQGDAFARLSEHVRTQAGAPTAAEAREALANREADITRLQATLEQAQNVAGEINTLADTITDQLRSTTSLSRGQARAAGRLMAERYAARAALFEPGTTAQSLYDRDRVTFEGEGQVAQPSLLEQPAVEVVQPGIDGTYRVTEGQVRAELNVAPNEPYASSVQVPGGMQRQGIATALYDAAERDLGRRMFPSPLGLTSDAQQFWIDRLSRIPQAEALALLDEAQVSGDARNVGRSTAERLAPIRESVLSRDPDQERSVFEQAAMSDAQGRPLVSGQSLLDGNRHGLMPHLLVDAAGAREGSALVLSSTTNANAQRQLEGIDEVLARHLDPLASPEAWSAMMADALASEAVPAAPYALIRDVNGDGAAQLLGGMTEGQIADADHGFANAADFRDMYINGEVTPVGTAKLFMWSFLSRGVSPYTQEALFIDGFSGVDAFIEMAAQGQFDYATSRVPYTQYGDNPQKVSLQIYKNAVAAYEGLSAKEKARKRKPQRKDADFVVESGEGGAVLLTYRQWARLSAPAGSGQPGAGASHNLNAFGKLFLSKMSEDAGLGDGRSRLSVLHDMMSDPTSTGKEVRRQFLRMGEGVGIDNKVVSFTLLVAGYNDVLVLDRVQMRQMWNDGRFDGLNLYDGYKEKGKVVNGSALSSLTYGARGLLIYEAMERSLMDRIATIYQAVGRPERASIGRYHWETWVASSNQEASHGTIDAIISEIKGNPDPLVGVTAKEGEYGSYAYGARYGRSGAGGAPYFLYEVPRGGLYKFSVPDFVRFQQEIKKPKNGVVPTDFRVTEGNGNAPWYFRSEVSLDGLNAVARANGGAPVEAEILGGNDVADGRDQDISDRRAADQPGPAWTEFEQGPVDSNRRSVVEGDSLSGDGRKFRDFFGAVTRGARQQAQNLGAYVPPITLLADVQAFGDSMAKFSGNFDKHIMTSIPGYREMQIAVAFAISRNLRPGDSLLRIGASEGSTVKAIIENAAPGASAVSMDPNPDMQRTFNEKPQVEGVRFDLSAFGALKDAGQTLWTESTGETIRVFDPGQQRFDVVVEQMVFQFISNDRNAQVRAAKELMNANGLFYTAEKVGGPASEYNANEAKKDEFKTQFYSEEELAAKRVEVLQTGGDAIEGMTELQVSDTELRTILENNFAFVVQVWDSGNFKGYAASDDVGTIIGFLEQLPPLESNFSTRETPAVVAGALPIPEQADGQQPRQLTQADRSLLERGIGPNPAQLRAASRASRAEADGRRRDPDASAGVTQQPVTVDDLLRFDADEAFGPEFLSRPGWGIVTATTELTDPFYTTKAADDPIRVAAQARKDAINAEADADLERRLQRDGVRYLKVQGVYKGVPDGTSYLIIADQDTTRRLGNIYGQESTLTHNGLVFAKPQPYVRPTGEVVVGDAATTKDFYSVLPSGRPFSLTLDFDNTGYGVSVIPAGYTTRADRPQLPVRPDGFVELYHWSRAERTLVDPTYAGTSGMRGKELSRGAKLSFYAINPRASVQDQGTGYVKENNLGRFQHVAFVDPKTLYPWFEDPQGLVAGKNASAAEAAIKAAGYLGHYVTEDGSGRTANGNVAVLYEALPVALVREDGVFEQPEGGGQSTTRGPVGAPRGSYRLPTTDDPRNLITLSANADPSTFVHEVGHMFLFQMVRDLADPRLTAEGRTQLQGQIDATRAWFSSNAEQALSELKAIAKSTAKRAAAAPDDAELQLRASRLIAAVQRAEAGGGAAYMEQVAQSFMDPAAPGRDEAAEVVYHELWARGFEKYLGTGSAPSAELRNVFAKFAQYISNVYKSLRRLNVTVSPEIADVFDRLLATEEAIIEERRGAMYQLSPGVLEGATPAEANELRRLASEAETQARTEMASRVENSLKTEARAKRRARREVLANEISEQVAAEPIYAAINIAKRGTLPDGTKTGTGKIDRAELVAVAGEEAVGRMPSGMVSGRVRPDNAIPLGDLATLSGFADIYSMIEALTNPTPTPETTAVKERVDAAMLQEFGADLDAQALQTKAVEVAQNDKFQQLQQLQLRILRRLAAQPMARIAQRQAEQEGAPAAAVDRAATEAAQAEQAAARTPREGAQASLARIRADVQRTANASQRRAQVAARRQTASIRLGMDTAAITEAAKRYVRTIKVKDATPARYRQAAARLTAKIERAIADRDYTQAATLMEQRALNLAVAKEASMTQTKIETQRTRWREVTARSDKRLAQRYSIDWVNAIRVALEPFGMARNTPRNYDPVRALADLQAVEPTLYTEIQLAISTYAARSQAAAQANPNNPYKDLSVQEALDLLETADTMLANARDSHGILVEGRRVEFGAIADEVSVNVSKRRKVQKQAGRLGRGRGSRTFRETRRQLGAFKASLRRIEQWARDFDNGNPRGPLTRYLVRPVMTAIDAYTVARKGPQEALAALLRTRTDLMARRPIRAQELDGYVFQTKGELIMALLHTGNDSNKRKLLLGGATDVETNRRYVWGSQDADGNLDTSRWDAFVDRLFADGVLTQADMELVQGIWDIFETTKQAAQAAHKQMYGYYFTEVQADPVVTPFGVYPGGYAPAITDSMMNPDGARFEAEEVMSQQSNASMFPGAEKGFTQSRTEYNQPLDLDLTRIPAHFDRVMKFAYLGPAVRQAARLVTNRGFREAVRPGSPDVIDVAVIPWLQRTVQQRVTTPPTNQGWSGLSRVAAAIDRRVGLHIMAANLVNAAQQITGFPVAAARIPANHIAAAATRWRVDNQSARAYIISQSPFMEDRLTGGMNEASTTLERILSEPGLLRKSQAAAMRYGYFAQQLAQNLVDPTVWLAAERHGMLTVYPDAYADALSRTGDEAAADAAARAEVVAYADSVVRDTQAPLRPSDVAGIEASSPLARLFLKFYSYFNAMGNLLVTEKNIAMNSDMGWAGRYGRSFYAYLMIVTIPTIIAESIAQLARGGFEDLEDEDERDQLMFELLIGSQLKTMAAMVPFAGSAASTVYGIAVTEQVYDDRISLSAGIGVTESTLQNLTRLIVAAADPDTDIETRRAIRTMLDALGLALGLPTNWASKPISYAVSVAEGDSRPEGFGDILQGALTGKDGTDR